MSGSCCCAHGQSVPAAASAQVIGFQTWCTSSSGRRSRSWPPAACSWRVGCASGRAARASPCVHNSRVRSVRIWCRTFSIRRHHRFQICSTTMIGLVSRSKRRYGGSLVGVVVLVFLGFTSQGFKKEEQPSEASSNCRSAASRSRRAGGTSDSQQMVAGRDHERARQGGPVFQITNNDGGGPRPARILLRRARHRTTPPAQPCTVNPLVN